MQGVGLGGKQLSSSTMRTKGRKEMTWEEMQAHDTEVQLISTVFGV